MSARVSQREARRLQKLISELQQQEQARRTAWRGEYPGGTEISRVDLVNFPAIVSSIATARKLGHAVVVIESGTSLRFVALPWGGEA